MLRLRKIVFYLFVLLYLILCPLTLLYAFGYLLKPGRMSGLVKTGLISLSSLPSDASVYIGNSRYTERTPTVLNDLLPGEYDIKLVLKNYRPWMQKIPVQAEKASPLKVLLVPKQFQPTRLWPGPLETILPLPGTHFFLLKGGARLGDLWGYNWKTEEGWPLVLPESSLYEAKPVTYFTVEGSPFVLVCVRFQNSEKFLWIDLRERERPFIDVTRLFPEKPTWVDWDPHDKREIFSLQHGTLNRLDLVSLAIFPGLVEKVRGYGISGKTLDLLKEDNTLERHNDDGKYLATLAPPALLNPFVESPLLEGFFGRKEFFRVKIFSEDYGLLWGEKGELISYLPVRPLVSSGVRGLEFDPPNRLLIWKEHALGLLTFSEQPEVFWLWENGKNIQQAFRVYGGSSVLLRDNEEMILLERTPYGDPQVYDLFEVQKGSAVFYSEESGKLYFLRPSDGSLCSAEILPQR